MNNRAIEFLAEAHSLLSYFGNDDKARLLILLAMDEVQELLDRLALCNATDYELTRRIEAQRMTPARLTESRRAALPGNKKL